MNDLKDKIDRLTALLGRTKEQIKTKKQELKKLEKLEKEIDQEWTKCLKSSNLF